MSKAHSNGVKDTTAILSSILDPAASNDISYQEVCIQVSLRLTNRITNMTHLFLTIAQFDGYVYRVANSIDDINLASESAAQHEDLSSEYVSRNLKDADYFLSNHLLSRLVHYEDLRDFASWHVVHRIVGIDMLEERLLFPSPNVWGEEGISFFWTIYENETGCSKKDLNGQDIVLVQRKLVLALINYEFAKFCWRSLVQPDLQHDACDELSTSSWVIDSNTKVTTTHGVAERILEDISSQPVGIDAGLDKDDTIYGCLNKSCVIEIWKVISFLLT